MYDGCTNNENKNQFHREQYGKENISIDKFS